MPRCLDDMPWRSLKGLGNLAPDMLHVGDFKNEPLKDGTPAQWRIIGFNHDVTASGLILPISWEMVDCMPDRYSWNDRDTTEGSWKGTVLRRRMNDPSGDIYQLMPDAIREVAVPVIKLTADTYTGENNLIESEDLFWIKSEKEMYGRNIYSAPGEGRWYEFYRQEDTPWTKMRGERKEAVLLRSPYYASAYYFCFVNNSGSANNSSADNSLGLAPAFAF